MSQSITLSVIIVNYNVREFLEQAINSVTNALGNLSHEIWVVDNASTDNSVNFIRRQFPDVQMLANRQNVGFAKANNQALAQCKGEYICLLNPDTIVEENTFSALLQFFDTHDNAGAVGCKVLNPDGSLQLACRRSFPTPWVAFTKIVGLAHLFPNNRILGRYNLTYLDPDQVAEVEAISGSFMLIRRQVLEQVGLLDESFFMYGEDLDYCYRIRNQGWKIFYVPDTRIIHFKGESSKKSPFEQRSLFYEAMRLFVHKHLHKGQALIPMWALLVAIRLRSLLSFLSAIVRYIALPAVDLSFLAINLSLAVYWRFKPRFPWQDFLIVFALYSAIWMTLLAWHGVYKRWKFSSIKAGSAMALGWVAASAVTFFFKEIGFSRLVVLYAGLLNLFVIPGWRLILQVAAHINCHHLHGSWGSRFLHPQTCLVMDAAGSHDILRRLQLRLENTYTLIGIVLVGEESDQKEIKGLPVLGYIEQIQDVIRQNNIQQVIFATERIANFQILSIISADHGRAVAFKWIPRAMDVIIGKASVDYVDDLAFLEIDYKMHYPGYRWVKRMMDVSLAAILLFLQLPAILYCSLVEKCSVQHETYIGHHGQPFRVHMFLPKGRKGRRHTSLQWWAILKGDMSLVGCSLQSSFWSPARPPIMKPGWTGLERLQEGMRLEEQDRDRLHLYYMKNYSVLLDLEIIFQTLMKTIKR